MKPNHIRIMFLIAIGIMFVSLMGKWEQTFPAQDSPAQPTQQEQDNSHYDVKDQSSQATTDKSAIESKKADFSKFDSSKTVDVNTKVFKDLKVSLTDGAIISASLKDYNVSLDDKTPMPLLTDESGSEYMAKSTIVVNKQPVSVNYTSQGIKKQDGKEVLTLVGSADGVQVTRTYTFDDAKYAISVAQKVTNTTASSVDVILDNSLVRDFDPEGASFSLLNAHSYTFTGVAYSTKDKKFMKESFKDISKMSKKPETVNDVGQGWVSFIQHYFMTAWIPQSTDSTIYYKNLGNDVYEAGEFSYNKIAPNASFNLTSVLYAGPIIKNNIADLAPNLDRALDYGMLSFFSKIIFVVMSWIHSVVGNWGLAIILVTVIIKAIFYPLSAKSYRSMAKMRMLQPRIKRLQEQHKDDKSQLGPKMMQLYKEEKVNPLSGCLPMIIQIPIFISLYWVLLESVELRQSPFIFWIHDLSMKDPFFVLPILMGASMFVQQRLSPAPADPMQAKVMMFLPLMFTFLFASFPAGLVLYWLTNNVISILQQWTITKRFEAAHKKK